MSVPQLDAQPDRTLTSARSALPNVPLAVASFGAAVAGDWLYVYGGHVGKTHQHSIDNLAAGFGRLDLRGAESWEALPSQQPLQGLALVSDGHSLYRIGGLSARNRAGEAEDLHSVAAAARFDPGSQEWLDLPPLPGPRSSHDAVVADGKLYVVGGWALAGEAKGEWCETALWLDLSSVDDGWQQLPEPPFERRALTVAVADGKLYAIGGIGSVGGTSSAVDMLDLAKGIWHEGPSLPSVEGLKGFGASALAVEDRVFVSLSDGSVHGLEADGSAWVATGLQLQTPRFFHRMLRVGEDLLFVAGANREGHLSNIERQPIALLAATSTTADPPAATVRWSGLRGPDSSRSEALRLPRQLSLDSPAGWNVELPGYGQSSPAVWDEQVFVTSVEGQQKETLLVSAVDLETGAVRWRRRFEAAQRGENSEMVARAAPTPVVDEERLYVFFGSGDLIALNHDGESIWHRALTAEFGEFQGNHGVASSPVLSRDGLVLLVDHQGPSYLMSLVKATGETRWKVDRQPRMSWSSPVVAPYRGAEEIVISSNGIVESFVAETGQRLWFVEGIEGNTAASPTVTPSTVFVGSSKVGHSLAIRRGGSGDVGQTHVLWRADATVQFSSPLLGDECVYLVSRAGVVRCLNPDSGEERWATRIGQACWASPVNNRGQVFFFAKNGVTTVLDDRAAGPELVIKSELAGSGTLYGVATVDNAWLLRFGSRLSKISALGTVAGR